MSDQAGQDRGPQPASDPESSPASASRRYGRRALMLGAVATGTGVAASVAGGSLAQAAPDKSTAVQLGKSNAANATTQIITHSGNGLKGQTSANGQSGVTGFDTSTATGGHGIYGNSVHGDGVLGISAHGNGVVGQSSTSNRSGVFGNDVAPTAGGHGVFAQSVHGDAVFASTPHGTALRGSSSNGFALSVEGRAKFRDSGVATVQSGHKTVSVPLAGISSSSIILATIQNPQGSISVAGAEVSGGSFTITLTASPSNNLHVGWLVLG